DWFAQTDAPALDIVITVCGNAANEACPVFPGDLLRSHWGLPDPAAVQGAQALSEAFRQAHAVISHRLIALLALPVETMPRDALQRALDHIGVLVGDDEIRA
ncbi:MAG: arsenate reductase ArsC, partial [Rhodanobacter sp.]